MHLARRFGVEIECVGLHPEEAAAALTEKGLPACVGRRSTDNAQAWKATTDGSLDGSGDPTTEVVSPILQDVTEARKAALALSRAGARVNTTCGLHVHMDAADFSDEAWRRLVLIYAGMEKAIDTIHAPSRRANRSRFAGSMLIEGTDLPKAVVGKSRTGLAANLYSGRFWKVNLEAFIRHRTVEFRQHAGTLNPDKIAYWVLLVNAITDAAVCRTACDIPKKAWDPDAAPVELGTALYWLSGEHVPADTIRRYAKIRTERKQFREAQEVFNREGPDAARNKLRLDFSWSEAETNEAVRRLERSDARRRPVQTWDGSWPALCSYFAERQMELSEVA